MACALTLAVAVLGAPRPAAAVEEANGFHPYAGYNVTRDSNLFRLSNAAQAQAVLGTSDTGETYRQWILGVAGDWTLSRQKVALDLSASQTQFDRYTLLDYNGGQLSARWDWRVGNDLNGDAGYSAARTLGSFASVQAVESNTVTRASRFADGYYALSPIWRVRLGGRRDSTRYGLASQQALDAVQDQGILALQYSSRAGNLLALDYRVTRGAYPHRQYVAGSLVDNGYRQTNWSARGEWSPTGRTRLSGNLGYTRREQNELSSRDFGGATGRIDAVWAAGGATSLTASAWRTLNAVEDLTASYALNKGGSLGVNWLPTAKIGLNASLGREQTDYLGDPGFDLGVNPLRVDKVDTATLSVSYAPFRKAQLGLSYRRERRHSNVELAGYVYYSVTASAQFRF